MKSLKTILIFCFRTSVLPSSHVESSFISDKISRSCFFGSVIQLAKFTSYDVIVALTCEFAVAEYQTLVWILYLFRFKDVTFESFSTLTAERVHTADLWPCAEELKMESTKYIVSETSGNGSVKMLASNK